MSEACETQDTLVSNNGVAKGTSDRAQALPNACCALPCTQFAKDQDTSIEQSNILLKQSVNTIDYANYIQSLLHCDIIIDTIEYEGIIGGAIGIK